MIDSPDSLPEGEMEKTLRELRLVNRWLGGAAAVLGPARRELLKLHRAVQGQRLLRVLDVGAGGADIALSLVRWAEGRGIALQIVAVDFNPQACALAVRFLRRQGRGGAVLSETRGSLGSAGRIEVAAADVFHLPFAANAFDLVLCSAFLHHFQDDCAVRVLQSLKRAGREAVLVNDLHRHPLAYWSFRLLSQLFSRSVAVKQDGPLSILRGFRRPELRETFLRAGFDSVAVSWRWAFRWSAAGRRSGFETDTRNSAMR